MRIKLVRRKRLAVLIKKIFLEKRKLKSNPVENTIRILQYYQ